MTAREANDLAKANYKSLRTYELPEPVQVMYYIIKSRRDGLTEAEVTYFEELISRNITLISGWGERWIVSIMDTLGENGHPALLVFSAIRMMEKMARPVVGHSEETRGERTAALIGADVHLNLMKRLHRFVPTEVYDLVESLLLSIASDPDSILGRFERLSKRSITRGMVSCLKL